MYQSFEMATSPETGAARLRDLRAELSTRGLDGFLIPRADAHQGENVAPRDERLSWLTGFTGSAGTCAVLPDDAGVFIDGRYTLQVRGQIDLQHFTPVGWTGQEVGPWIVQHLPTGTIGFDPWLHTPREIDDLRATLSPRVELRALDDNPLDCVWADQPAAPADPIVPHGLDVAGELSADKRRRLAAELTTRAASAAVLSLPDSIAWLLNIRGSDIARTPVALLFAVLHVDGTVDLFGAKSRTDDTLRDHLGPDVRLHDMDVFADHLRALQGTVALDHSSAPVWIADRLNETVDFEPVRLPKARKNAAEIEGSRAAHRRDAVAMVEFLRWLDENGPSGTLTEIAIAQQLESYRRATNQLRDISFETISGSGPNGAIVHYRVNEASDRTLSPGELMLVDSGGQYADGTTDITRTVAVGPVDPDAARAFTLVLRGMIAISQLRWPAGLGGAHIDALARAPLWSAGMDYAHGTGHGVGAYLGVHEGPQSLSRRSTVPFEPGNILSNEPGYYREGAFGIRIENLLVVEQPSDIAGGDLPMLSFETLTLVPIDRRLIIPHLLSAVELQWLDQYHKRVCAEIGALVPPATREWLNAACAPLSED
ncbi:Xaa-Pro aminopeptidase [Monaibacterium marinum]|uniref:Xaa-Pro aminopeptidase n=1 Tax=Pontivivens marinum TaxID=1690039 RepID=A0A2C9CUM4_9RHOB|nr:aminopeptidase P family protein [Monaibacterium marinum]SOH94099.1 Xaa-Pro aminopeptidase [Monaibacterium marinum]